MSLGVHPTVDNGFRTRIAIGDVLTCSSVAYAVFIQGGKADGAVRTVMVEFADQLLGAQSGG